MSERETAVANREMRMQIRERAMGEHEIAVAEREDLVRLREQALRAQAAAEQTRVESSRLVEPMDPTNAQMKHANEQLLIATVRADEMAETAREGERAKDEFMAMLGHELRNPLSPILTAVDLMEMRDPDSCPGERAMIRRQVRHMVRLVDDLLDISRITRGKVELHREPIELSDPVGRAVELVSPLLEAKQHELIVRVPTTGLMIDADLSRMTQVAANLITNAAKYTPAGGRIVVTGCSRGTDVVLSVKDNGVGISSDMLPRVFDMFAQERQALDRAQGGLGLGLAIVQTLVSLHDGRVTAHSEGRDRGSEFVVELPALRAGVVMPHVQRERVDATPAVVPLKVLVVDDNQDAADLIAQVLSQLGHRVRVAYDGPGAIAVVAEFVPDVALLDIGLPGMDGYELARHLRARLGDAVRLVAVSGYGQNDARRRSLEAGFSRHVVKPVTVAMLRDALISAIAT